MRGVEASREGQGQGRQRSRDVEQTIMRKVRARPRAGGMDSACAGQAMPGVIKGAARASCSLPSRADGGRGAPDSIDGSHGDALIFFFCSLALRMSLC